MGRTIRGVLAVLAAVLVAGCSVRGAPTVSTDYAHASVTGTQAVKAPHGAEQVVSPDGQKLFYIDGGQPCVWTLADHSHVCAPKDTKLRAGPYSGQWSPDSSAVAFTDDYLQSFWEPDIWVMQADDGSLRDITDDHIEDAVLGPKAEQALIDLRPTWLDTTTIVFGRQHGSKGSGTDISSISASGGTVTTLFHLKQTVQYINGMAVSPDGHTVAYSIADHDFKSATVHLRSLDGGGADNGFQMHSKYDASMLSFSADGAYLLADSRLPYTQFTNAPVTGTIVLNIADRSKATVAKDGGCWYPTWSPTGHALAFLTGRNTKNNALRMVAKPGGTPRKLTSGKHFPLIWEVLRWSPSGILMSTPDGFTTVTVTTS